MKLRIYPNQVLVAEALLKLPPSDVHLINATAVDPASGETVYYRDVSWVRRGGPQGMHFSKVWVSEEAKLSFVEMTSILSRQR